MDTPVSPPAATAGRAILAGQVRHALVALGTLAITRGIATQGQVDAIVPGAVDYIVGTLLVIGASLWSAARAAIVHSRWAEAWTVLVAPQAASPLSPAAAGQAGSDASAA